MNALPRFILTLSLALMALSPGQAEVEIVADGWIRTICFEESEASHPARIDMRQKILFEDFAELDELRFAFLFQTDGGSFAYRGGITARVRQVKRRQQSIIATLTARPDAPGSDFGAEENVKVTAARGSAKKGSVYNWRLELRNLGTYGRGNCLRVAGLIGPSLGLPPSPTEGSESVAKGEGR